MVECCRAKTCLQGLRGSCRHYAPHDPEPLDPFGLVMCVNSSDCEVWLMSGLRYDR